MKKLQNFIDSLNQKLFSSTYQLQRIVILTAVVLVVAVASFAAYYYYDRYYRSQPTTKEISISHAEQAVINDPTNVDKRLALAETYMTFSRFEDAIQQILQVKQTNVDNVQADFLLGISYANTAKPQLAIEPLGKFIEKRKNEDYPALDNQLKSALYYLGDCYLQLGQPENAIEPLSISANLSKTDADVMYKLGLAYQRTQKYSDAISWLSSATVFVPNFTESYQAQAEVYNAMNQPILANYALGMVAYSKKDYKTAIEMISKTSQSEPNFEPAFVGLGLSYEAAGNLQNAKSAYESALKLNNNDFTALTGVKRVDAQLNK